MLNLSSEQKIIVMQDFDKHLQVLASAGSGKTRVLTERIRYILNNTKKDKVLAFTFTNKAAAEMKSRLEDCNEAQDRLWVSTIHSVGQRIIEKYGHNIGLPDDLHIFDRDKDRMEVFIQSLRKSDIDIDEYLDVNNSKEHKDRMSILQSYMDAFSEIKRELWSEDEAELKYPNSNIWKYFQDYQDSLIESAGIDYDDLLLYSHRILLNFDWISKIYRSQYKHICVDEAQDLNKAQYEFIKALCGKTTKSIMMVGDPDQMIYGFIGSSKDYFCSQYISDFKPVKYELKKNYRSSKSVISAANIIKPGAQRESDFAIDGRFELNVFNSEQEEAEDIILKIEKFLKIRKHPDIESEITLQNIVVLARNRFVFKELEKQLKSRKLSYNLKKGERQSESSTKIGKMIDYALRVKLNPRDWVNGKKLYKLLEVPVPNSWDENILSELAIQIRLLNVDDKYMALKAISYITEVDTEEPNMPKLFKKLEDLISEQLHSTLSSDKIEEINLSLNELNEFKGAWTTFRKNGLGSTLTAFRNAMALGQLSKPINSNALTLSTVHTMKGLEKDIVFLIGMCEGVFPDYRAKSQKELEEERNNAFVAVTRAKRWLFVSYPMKRMMPWGKSKYQSKSRFFEELNNGKLA